MQTAWAAPEYSVIFIADNEHVDAPIHTDLGKILANSDCITLTCLTWQDGETQFELGPASEAPRDREPAFRGILETPHRRIRVMDVESTDIPAADTPGTRTKVSIWTNHPTEPDHVIIAYD